MKTLILLNLSLLASVQNSIRANQTPSNHNQEVAQKAQYHAEHCSQAAVAYMTNTAHTVGDTMSDLKDKTLIAADAALESAEQTTHEVHEHTVGIAEKAGAWLDHAAHITAQAAIDAKNKIAKTAVDTKNQVAQTVHDTKEKVVSVSQEATRRVKLAAHDLSSGASEITPETAQTHEEETTTHKGNV